MHQSMVERFLDRVIFVLAKISVITLQKKLYYKLIWRNISKWMWIWRDFKRTVWKSEKFSLIKEIFRQINSLVKSLLSRNFCQKCARLKLRNFHALKRSLSSFIKNDLTKKTLVKQNCNWFHEKFKSFSYSIIGFTGKTAF